MKLPINLPKELFYIGQGNHNITLNISEPSITHFSQRTKNIKTGTKGVYVIFDQMAGDNWETPNPPTLGNEHRHCLYVGEGKIRTRLNNHNYTSVGRYAGYVVYYQVSDIADRKLLERLLIKHYIPIFNKEGQYPYKIKKDYMDDRDTYLTDLINEINSMQEENSIEPNGQKIINNLLAEDELTLTEIHEIIWSILSGLSPETTRQYKSLIERK